MPEATTRNTFRFQEFELNVVAYELRHRGRRVRLERRPMDLLILMVERRGELITRGEIVKRLWGDDVFIEIETAVNTLVRKIRLALRDSADEPTFVETVPGKGYRFIAAVEVVAAPPKSPVAPASTNPVDPLPQSAPVAPTPRDSTARRATLVAGAIVLALALWLFVWRPAATVPSHVSLAVLPFVAINVDPDRDYIGDALHEETIASLGQIDPEHLRVLGRTSMLGYKGTTKSLAQIGKELGVEYLVETSVVTEQARVRITPKLIRVRDQAQIWAEAYDAEPVSMLEFQRDLGAQIAEQIRLQLSPDRIAAVARRHTSDADAYDLYLRGLYLWNQLKPETNRRAVEYYRRATTRDPNYALAWAGLALAYAGAPINADAPPRAMWPLARDAAERGIAADPRLAETQTAMGMVQFWLEWNWNRAAAAFQEAAKIDPSYPLAQRMLGIVASHQTRHAEARQSMDRLRRLEPLYAMNWALSAQVAFNATDYQGALEHARQSIVISPEFWIGRYHLAMAAERRGDQRLAIETLDHALASGPANSKLHALRGFVLATTDREIEARDVIRTLEEVSRTQYVPPYAIALVHAGLRDGDAALEWLERAYQAHDVHLVALPTDAKWDRLRHDARFAALIDRCGFMTPRS